MAKLDVRLDTEDGKLHLEYSGDAQTMAAMVSYITNRIYQSMRRKNPLAAAAFKLYVRRGMGDGAPTWEFKPKTSTEGGPEHD